MGLRLQFFYFFIIGIGGSLFFLPVWLECRGVDIRVIGLIMSMTYVSKIVFGPVAAIFSDMGLNSKNIILVLGGIGIIGLLCMLPESCGLAYVFSVLVATGGFQSIVPIGENITLNAINSGDVKLDYGQIRAVGTIAYAFIAVISGIILNYFYGNGYLIWLMVACTVIIVIQSRFLNDVRNLKAIKESRARYLTLFKQKDAIAVFSIAGLYYVSAGMLTGLGSAHFKAIGISATVSGLLIIPMIFTESIFFFSAKKHLNGVPYQKLLLVASCASVVRWVAMAFVVNPWLIAVCQMMHALTFASVHLATMNYIRTVIPVNLAARAQSTYDAGCSGLLMGISIVLYGVIYPLLREKTFLVAAAFSLIAVVLSLTLKGKRLRRKTGN